MQAILAPIVFFDLLGLPITKSRLNTLIYKQKLTYREFHQALNYLRDAGIISIISPILPDTRYPILDTRYVYFSDNPQVLANIEPCRQATLNHWHQVKHIIHILTKVPFVRTIGLKNSLSFGSARMQSDVDLFVIVKAPFIALARDVINLILGFKGARAYPHHRAGKIAIEVWLDTQNLHIEDFRLDENDHLLNFWAAHLTPVYNEGNVFQEFLKANSWLKKAFPHHQVLQYHQISLSIKEQNIKAKWEKAIQSKFGRALNKWLTHLELTRLQGYKNKTPGTLLFEPGRLRFHATDLRVDFNKKFEKRLARLLDLISSRTSNQNSKKHPPSESRIQLEAPIKREDIQLGS